MIGWAFLTYQSTLFKQCSYAIIKFVYAIDSRCLNYNLDACQERFKPVHLHLSADDGKDDGDVAQDGEHYDGRQDDHLRRVQLLVRLCRFERRIGV